MVTKTKSWKIYKIMALALFGSVVSNLEIPPKSRPEILDKLIL